MPENVFPNVNYSEPCLHLGKENTKAKKSPTIIWTIIIYNHSLQ